MENVEKLIRKLDTNTLKKLYGMTIEVTPGQFFPNPRTGEPMLGDTWYFHGKPYLILLGTKPSPRVVYHEIAHAIGIEDEELAMKFAIEQEARLKSRGVTPTAEAAKEPWQMSREEFTEKYESASWHPEYIEARGKVRAIVDKTGKSGIELGREGNKEYLEAKAEMDAQLDIRNTPHVEHVRRALAEGKPVPPKVLADYPSL
ncbi:hypothetical protein ES703_95111 [subsurface metagenome]